MALTCSRGPVLLTDYVEHDALALAAFVRDRVVSPRELLDAALESREAGHALPLLADVRAA
jgi:hypothetical protein